jgi:CubicO group peptidase (beta-lactamase class C family)
MRHTGWITGAVLLAASAGAMPIEAQRAGKNPLDGLAAYVEQMRQDWKVPGLALAIVRNDSIIFARGFGVRELGKPEPVDEHTIFAIASCTKAFTATLVGMLTSEGKFAWDDRATDRLPGFRLYDPYVTQEITLRDLLSHRSGLARGDGLWYGTTLTRDDVIQRVRYLEPSWSFRSTYGYQNIMFTTAGEIAAKAAGTTWDRLVRERIFLPLGMLETNTSVSALEGLLDVAAPHEEIHDTIQVIEWRNVDNIGGAGTINSSIADMAQWVRLQLRDGRLGERRIVDSAVIAETHSPQTMIPRTGLLQKLVPEGHFYAYGMGWFLQDYRGRMLIQHGGNLDGMSAYVALMPEEHVGFVMLSNLSGSPLRTPLQYRIFDTFIGGGARDWSREWKAAVDSITKEGKERDARIDSSRVMGTEPSLPIERFAGTYHHRMYGEFTLAIEDDHPVLRQGPSFVGDLDRWHFDTYRILWRDRSLGRDFVTFRLDPKGEPSEAVLGLEGETVYTRSGP